MRHQGSLPDEYIKRLERMSLKEVAVEAARLRSDGRRCGTATARVLDWARRHKVAQDPSAISWFYGLYRAAWNEEKEARAAGLSSRPETRPVVGGRWRYRGPRIGVKALAF